MAEFNRRGSSDDECVRRGELRESLREWRDDSVSRHAALDDRVVVLAKDIGALAREVGASASAIEVQRSASASAIEAQRNYNIRYERTEGRLMELERVQAAFNASIKTELRIWGSVIVIVLPLLMKFWKV